VENNIQDLITGFKEPMVLFYNICSNINYKFIGEFLFMASCIALFYLFCYCWVLFCIKITPNTINEEKKINKWIARK